MRAWLVFCLLAVGLLSLSQPTIADGLVFTLREFDPRSQTFVSPPAGENSVLLAPGQSLSLDCPQAPEGSGILCLPQFALDVPPRSTGLTFQVQGAGEFIVFLRLNAEIDIQDGRAVADFASQSQVSG